MLSKSFNLHQTCDRFHVSAMRFKWQIGGAMWSDCLTLKMAVITVRRCINLTHFFTESKCYSIKRYYIIEAPVPLNTSDTNTYMHIEHAFYIP